MNTSHLLYPFIRQTLRLYPYFVYCDQCCNKCRGEDISFPYSIDDRDLILNEIVDLTQKSHRVYNDNQNNPDLSLSILAKSFAYAAYDSKEQLEVTDIISSIEDCDRIYATAKSTTINRIKNCKKSESDDKKNKVIKLEFE